MKYRFTNNEMLAGAMALGLISAGVDFDYEHYPVDLDKHGKHRIWANGEVPESCEPEKWTDI